MDGNRTRQEETKLLSLRDPEVIEKLCGLEFRLLVLLFEGCFHCVKDKDK